MATFGKTTNGSNVQTFSGDRSYICSATPDSSGTVTNGSGRVRITSAGSTLAKMVIYSDLLGEPLTLLATSDEVTVDFTTSTLTDFPFSGANQISIVSGTPYWIGFIFDDPGTPSFEMKRDNTASLVRFQAVTYPTPPSPFVPDGSSNGPLNASIDYTVSGGSLVKTMKGLAIASVKTKKGLAIASVKTEKGLTNV